MHYRQTKPLIIYWAKMLHGIDISHWQGGKVRPATVDVDFYIMKSTEGTSFVDKWCDPIVQECISTGKLWGFYHFASTKGATAEADFFYENTRNYLGHGVPVLDWEGGQSVAWVNEFVRRIHELSGIWPWIYANPWRFDQGGVEANCMRWVARYPSGSMTFEQAEARAKPKADGLVGAWQFTSSGRLSGYSGNLDLDLFYGDAEAWRAYAGSDASSGGVSGSGGGDSGADGGPVTLENDEYKVTIERKEDG